MEAGNCYLLVDTSATRPATAVAKGLQDTKYYMIGCKNLFVATDHSAMVTVLGDRSMVDVENPSLASIKEKTLWWQFKILDTP